MFGVDYVRNIHWFADDIGMKSGLIKQIKPHNDKTKQDLSAAVTAAIDGSVNKNIKRRLDVNDDEKDGKNDDVNNDDAMTVSQVKEFFEKIVPSLKDLVVLLKFAFF